MIRFSAGLGRFFDFANMRWCGNVDHAVPPFWTVAIDGRRIATVFLRLLGA